MEANDKKKYVKLWKSMKGKRRETICETSKYRIKNIKLCNKINQCSKLCAEIWLTDLRHKDRSTTANGKKKVDE